MIQKSTEHSIFFQVYGTFDSTDKSISHVFVVLLDFCLIFSSRKIKLRSLLKKVNSLTTKNRKISAQTREKTQNGRRRRHAHYERMGKLCKWVPHFCLFMLFRTEKILKRVCAHPQTPDANTLLGEAPPLVYLRWLLLLCHPHFFF